MLLHTARADQPSLDAGALDPVVLDPGALDPGGLDAAPPQRVFPDVAAAAALGALTSAGPYLPWGAGTLRVAGLVAVCNDVVLSGRRRVVELGSGTSTVLLARLLRQRWPDGGYVHVAVEHDSAWAAWVGQQLAREGLHGPTTVVHAPLMPHPHGLDWYDPQAVRTALDVALGDDPVDLLVVDGPPADTREKVLARYPALPALIDRLAPGATVVLDDVERPGEQDVLRRWEAELGLALRVWGPTAGVAIGRLPAAQPPATPAHG